MPPTLFLTGYPGFLGSALLPGLFRRRPELRARLLVQPKFASLARERARELGDRVEIVEGDITKPLTVSADDVVEIWHLAAVYDLGVKRDAGMLVNVHGTRNVLDFAQRCRSLERFHYFSTCYVSGRFRGTFLESDLERGQTFNNYYEETKYIAEVEVQRCMRAGVPTTIYRPAIVVGDSTTGSTQKYDGPYYVMQWILRQPRIAILPVLPRGKEFVANVVPRDFVLSAIERLSAMPQSRDKVYQLADPDPMTITELIDAIAQATGRTIVRIPLPKWLAKGSLQYVPGLYRFMRIAPAIVDYMDHPTRYDTTNTRTDLGSYSIPKMREYLPNLVSFVRAHPEIGANAMA